MAFLNEPCEIGGAAFAGPVYSLACNPADATLVATGGGDDITFLWRIGEGDFHHTLQGTVIVCVFRLRK